MTDSVKNRLKALVVEDYADSRRIFTAMLEMLGFCVAGVASGREAVEVARFACPDLILMDLNLPEMDGLAATRQIRDFKYRSEPVQIVAVTAFNTYGMKEAALEAGCDDYLVKPVTFSELDKAVRPTLAT